MALSSDIVATWRGPGKVIRRFLGYGRQEGRALSFLLIACVLYFIAQMPWQAREAHLDDTVPLQARLYWSGFLFVFLMPLALYAMAGLIALLARVARLPIGGYAVRLTLFWALLAAVPAGLLAGLVAAFNGPGLELQITVVIWLAAFLWIWLAGLRGATEDGNETP